MDMDIVFASNLVVEFKVVKLATQIAINTFVYIIKCNKKFFFSFLGERDSCKDLGLWPPRNAEGCVQTPGENTSQFCIESFPQILTCFL